LLDSAIWRRFGYRLELNFPSTESRGHIWGAFKGQLQFTPREMELLVDLSEGFSGSDIREACIRLHSRKITHRQAPTLRDALEVLQNLSIGEGEDRRFLSMLRGKGGHAISTLLRERDAKLYTHAVIAELLGVSKATAYRWTKGEASDG